MSDLPLTFWSVAYAYIDFWTSLNDTNYAGSCLETSNRF